MLTSLTVLTTSILLAMVIVAGLALVVTRAVWRRLRRRAVALAPAVHTARQRLTDGTLTLAACRPRPLPDPAVVRAVVRMARADRQLQRLLTEAERSGAHLGDAPALLPRLQVDSRRIRSGLAQLSPGAGAARSQLLAHADRHLAAVADLREAVRAATFLPAADESLRSDAEEAARGLRCYTAAYTELTTPRRPEPALAG